MMADKNPSGQAPVVSPLREQMLPPNQGGATANPAPAAAAQEEEEGEASRHRSIRRVTRQMTHRGMLGATSQILESNWVWVTSFSTQFWLGKPLPMMIGV